MLGDQANGAAQCAPGTRRPHRALAAALLVLCAVVLGVHASVGARFSRDWFAGDPGGHADLAWRQADCLGRAVAEAVPDGARVHVVLDSEPLAQRLMEYAFLEGTVVAGPGEADIVLSAVSTPGRGCEGATLRTMAPPGAGGAG